MKNIIVSIIAALLVIVGCIFANIHFAGYATKLEHKAVPMTCTVWKLENDTAVSHTREKLIDYGDIIDFRGTHIMKVTDNGHVSDGIIREVQNKPRVFFEPARYETVAYHGKDFYIDIKQCK